MARGSVRIVEELLNALLGVTRALHFWHLVWHLLAGYRKFIYLIVENY